MEPKKESLEPGPEQDQKPRLDSANSSESVASSGFQEDKSVSDAEEDEGRCSFLPGLQSVLFLYIPGISHIFVLFITLIKILGVRVMSSGDKI